MPFYDDFEMKKSVENFARRVQRMKRFENHVIPQMEALIARSMPTFYEILALPERTEEENEALKLVLRTMRDYARIQEDINLVLQERLRIEHLMFYDDIKELAAEGNARARDIFEGLKHLEDEEPSVN